MTRDSLCDALRHQARLLRERLSMRPLAHGSADLMDQAADHIEAMHGLLVRIQAWDMLYVKPDGTGIVADGPYWQREIAKVIGERRA